MAAVRDAPGAPVAPTPRRGALLDPIDANTTSHAVLPPSPSKPTPTELTHPFCEGSYSGSWACGRPEGRGACHDASTAHPLGRAPHRARDHVFGPLRMRSATGTYTSHLGSSFVGVWRRGWADGAGVYHWSDGRADVGRFNGEAERLPLLAATGEGVRWSADRSRASLLRNGVEIEEEIPAARAVEIAERLGILPPVPPPRLPPAHTPARVSKRELESFAFLSKRQRTAIDTRLSTTPASEGEGEAAALPFEALWELLCPKS